MVKMAVRYGNNSNNKSADWQNDLRIPFAPVDALKSWRNTVSDLENIFNQRKPITFFQQGNTSDAPVSSQHEEEEARHIFRLQVPGFKAHEIEISYSENTLKIVGTKQMEETNADGTVKSWSTFFQNKFERAWKNISQVNVDEATAELEDGILVITLPKAAAALPAKITIMAKNTPPPALPAAGE